MHSSAFLTFGLVVTSIFGLSSHSAQILIIHPVQFELSFAVRFNYDKMVAKVDFDHSWSHCDLDL